MTKLEEYQQNEMVPSQTGFVAGGTTVHIVRAIQLIKAPTNRGKVCFGFFIDLKSPYNTLYHDRLMQRLGTKFCSLKRCEWEDKAKTGKCSAEANVGLPQGSLLSHDLLTVYRYLETILKELMMARIDFQILLVYEMLYWLYATALSSSRR